MLSYWEKKHFLKSDLIVVGAGFVGLSTAIHYKRAFPEREVLVLERGAFPTGASTKNAGFACFGSLTEILDDLSHMSEDEVLELVRRRYVGLKSIRAEFGDQWIDYRSSGGFELLDEQQLSALVHLDQINALLAPIFPEEVFCKVADPEKFGFSKEIKAVVKNRYEGELDPGQYLAALWQRASREGVKILTGMNVLSIQHESAEVEVASPSGGELMFQGQLLAICTNAFTSRLLPKVEAKPGRGLILLSEKLKFPIPWEGSFHVDRGYVYFRKVDGRLLMGGGRNVDFAGEEQTEFFTNPKIKDYLTQLTQDRIFPGKSFQWEMEWTGIMAFGPSKSPIIQACSQRSAMAVRLGGMGVAIGWQVGQEMAVLLGEM